MICIFATLTKITLRSIHSNSVWSATVGHRPGIYARDQTTTSPIWSTLGSICLIFYNSRLCNEDGSRSRYHWRRAAASKWLRSRRELIGGGGGGAEGGGGGGGQIESTATASSKGSKQLRHRRQTPSDAEVTLRPTALRVLISTLCTSS